MNKRRSHIVISIAFAFYFLLLSAPSTAQICTGSLGDAVVNVTFGSGGNPGPALPASTTNYGFTNSSCPNDGSYTLVNSTAGCFGNSWKTYTEDHTPGDANGYMMLVNASVTPGDFYVDTVRNLCSGTNYEFGAWITNVIFPSACSGSPTQPQLSFKIETPGGIVLGNYSTGNIAEGTSPVWKQYGFFFTTPANSPVIVIRITNNAPGGCGNDLALDDITFRPCGPTVTAGFANVNTPAIDLCIDDISSTTLSATVSSGYTTPAYQWQVYAGAAWIDIAGATALTYVRNATGTAGAFKYRLTVAEASNIGISNCRVASNEAVVTVNNPPLAAASNSGPVCEGNTITLSGSGGISYSWSGSGGFSAAVGSPSFTAIGSSAGQYQVIVSDGFGCSDTAFTTVATFAAPVAVVSIGQTICGGDSAFLQAAGGNSYTWLPVNGLSDAGSGNPVAKPDSTTTYTVTVTGNNNCTDTASVVIAVNRKPLVSAGDDKSIVKGQSIVLDGNIDNLSAVNFGWNNAGSLDNAALLTPVATPVIATQYILTANSAIGCGNTADTVLVKVYDDLFIPNAFAPGGRNPFWHIEALSAYPNAVITVFNRFGEKIYEGKGNAKGWDGTYKNMGQATGAYPYILDLRNGRAVIKGMVVLVR